MSKVEINGNLYPMKLEIVGGKIVGLKDTIISGAIGIEDVEDFDTKCLVKRSQFTTGRGKDAGYVPASWLPKELQAFCENPGSVELPKTVRQVSIIQPMNMDKIKDGNPKGQAILGFISHLPQAIGDDRKRTYLTGYEFINEETIQSLEADSDDDELGRIHFEL